MIVAALLALSSRTRHRPAPPSGPSSSRRNRSASRICSPRCSRSCSRRAGCASIGVRASAPPSLRSARCDRARSTSIPSTPARDLLAILARDAAAAAPRRRFQPRVGASSVGASAFAGSRRLGFENSVRDRRAPRDGRLAASRRRSAISARHARSAARRTHGRLHRPGRRPCRAAAAHTVSISATCARSDPAIKYQALAAGQVDVIDGYSTDGLIARYTISSSSATTATSSRRTRPPPLVGASAWRRTNPRAIAALEELGGRLDVATMRALNKRVEVDGEPVAVGRARRAARTRTRRRRGDRRTRRRVERVADRSVRAYLVEQRATIARLALRHIELVAAVARSLRSSSRPLGLCSSASRVAPRRSFAASACCRRSPASRCSRS